MSHLPSSFLIHQYRQPVRFAKIHCMDYSRHKANQLFPSRRDFINGSDLSLVTCVGWIEHIFSMNCQYVINGILQIGQRNPMNAQETIPRVDKFVALVTGYPAG